MVTIIVSFFYPWLFWIWSVRAVPVVDTEQLRFDRSGPTEASAPASGELTRREVACGVEASESLLHRDPWLVRLRYARRDGSELSLRCAGVLVAPDAVLTAAHCLVATPPPAYHSVQVVVGEYDLNNTTDCVGSLCAPLPLTLPVAERHVYERYVAGALHHDLALLRLARPAPSTDFIRPVCLPDADTRVGAGTALHATGWGELAGGRSGQYAHLKKNITLPAWDGAECRRVYAAQRLPAAVLCAGGVAGVDTCRGDSGGPLTWRAGAGGRVVLLGVTAAGNASCGTRGYPGLYTRVRDYLPWIRHTLASHSSH